MKKVQDGQNIFGMILLLSNKLQLWGEHVMKEMTVKQWFLLNFISKMRTNTPTIQEIADFSGTSRQNVRKMIEQLEKRGYLISFPSIMDARALTVMITEKTNQFFLEYEKTGEEEILKLFEGISPEKMTVMMEGMEQLLQNLNDKRRWKKK